MKEEKVFARRILAAVLDFFIYAIIMKLFEPFFCTYLGYHYNGFTTIFSYYFLSLSQDFILGRSLSKIIFNLKIVFLNDDKNKYFRLFVRRIFDILDLILPIQYLLFLLLSRKNQKLGDLLANTKVIHEKYNSQK